MRFKNIYKLFAWSSLLLGPSRLKIGSELSQAWVRFDLGPKNTKGPSCLGSELSGYLHEEYVKDNCSARFHTRGYH